MPVTTAEQARLSVIRTHNWLTKSERHLWLADNVAEELNTVGMTVAPATVAAWFKTMLNLQSLGGRART